VTQVTQTVTFIYKMLIRHCLCLALILGLALARRGGGGFRTGGGGGWFSRGSSSSSSRGGWFSRSSSSSRSSSVSKPSSTYPKQQWGSSGTRTNSIGSGTRTNSIGGGGFVNPRNSFKTNPYGTKQYSGWNTPRSAVGGVHSFGGQKYGYRTPGYGTKWGTNFAGGAGKYSKGYSGKALGLGVAAGFLGGAALTTMGTMAMYSVYHRYNMYMMMMHMNNPMMYNYNRGYYNNYYNSNICRDGCPMNAHCEWGFCECNAGTTRKNGQCVDRVTAAKMEARDKSFDPFVTCSEKTTCQKIDMNLICNTNLTTNSDVGKCECRHDMRWNAEGGECQLFLDVDCSSITYESQPSQTILNAVDKAQAQLDADPTVLKEENLGRTESANESLANSLLNQIDAKNATAEEIKEAFCRDIDSFSFEMEPSKEPLIIDERPSSACSHVPRSACAIAYDSHDCTGGWKLVIPEGQLRFRWFTSYWSYRNDMDTVGVRPGCTLYLFTDSDFTGSKVRIDAYPDNERWIVLGEHAGYQHMDEDVEAVQCYCNLNQG